MNKSMRYVVGQTYKEQADSGYLSTLEYWSIIIAYGLAAAEGIKLTDRHFEVIGFLRGYYHRYGALPSRYAVKKLLVDTFTPEGGLTYLSKLFPNDPVSQSLRIAGLPMPDTIEFDPSTVSLH